MTPKGTALAHAPATPEPAAATKITLHEAVEALMISDSWLEETEGELTPELEALIEGAKGDFKEKVDRVAVARNRMRDRAKALKEGEEARIVARRRAMEKRVAGIENYLERCLIAAGIDKVEGTLTTCAMQLNNPSVVVADDVDLTELRDAGAPFIRVIPETLELDKKEVLAAVKRAEAEGRDQDAVLPATIRVVRTRSLRIR